jgi:hypothetical protein
MDGVRETLRSADIFPKLDVGYLQRTRAGGVASLVALALILGLASLEAHNFMLRPRLTMNIDVDSQHLQEWIHLSFRLTVATECGQLLVAVVDAGGQKTLLNDKLDGAHVRMTVEGGRVVDGCRIEAHNVKLNRVNGKLVMLPLTGVVMGPMGQLLVAMDPRINFSHHIDHLLFSSPNPGDNQADGKGHRRDMEEHDSENMSKVAFAEYSKNPLKGLERLNLRQHEHVTYKLAVVATRHLAREGGPVVRSGAQYAVKGMSNLPGDPKSAYFLPGLYFEYDLEPLAINVYRQEPLTWWQFAKRLLGIIGGVFVCSGLIHQVCFFVFVHAYLPWRNQRLYGRKSGAGLEEDGGMRRGSEEENDQRPLMANGMQPMAGKYRTAPLPPPPPSSNYAHDDHHQDARTAMNQSSGHQFIGNDSRGSQSNGTHSMGNQSSESQAWDDQARNNESRKDWQDRRPWSHQSREGA